MREETLGQWLVNFSVCENQRFLLKLIPHPKTLTWWVWERGPESALLISTPRDVNSGGLCATDSEMIPRTIKINGAQSLPRAS